MKTLKGNKSISNLFDNGKKTVIKTPFRILIVSTEGKAGFLIGATKKKFKRAVDRNRIKRLIRVGLTGINTDKSIGIIFIDDKMPDKRLIAQIRNYFK
jgi:ribonuclease P protein component